MFSDYGDVVTVSELAKMLKIGRNTAYKLVRSGAVKSVTIGRQIRIPKRNLIDFCNGSCYAESVAAISRCKEVK